MVCEPKKTDIVPSAFEATLRKGEYRVSGEGPGPGLQMGIFLTVCSYNFGRGIRPLMDSALAFFAKSFISCLLVLHPVDSGSSDSIS